MTKIASLMDEETREQLTALVTHADADAPAKTTKAPKEVPFVVTKRAVDPNPPRPLTARDAIDIDPESEAMIDATCVDCGVPVLIDPKVPEGVDPEAPRVPICEQHAKERARWEIANERRVQAIRRPQIARHRPRTTDGIDHPVTVTNHKEKPVTDFNSLSDAELGALVRMQMKAISARDITGAAPEVLEQRAAEEAEHKEAIAVEQIERKKRVYPSFMVSKDFGVPVLDLTEVTSLDEQPSAAIRSPYNKARFRLLGEGPLPVPDADGLLPEGAEATTYRTLIAEHKRLRKLAKAKGEKAKAPKAKAKEVTVVVAATDPAEDARMVKATALSKVLSCTVDQALALMDA